MRKITYLVRKQIFYAICIILLVLLIIYLLAPFFKGTSNTTSQSANVAALIIRQPQVRGTVYSQVFKVPVSSSSLKSLVPAIEGSTNIKIDHRISDRNFMTALQVGADASLEIMSFNLFVSGDRIIQEIDRLGYRPASMNEFLSFVQSNYESSKNIKITTEIPSAFLIDGKSQIPAFEWLKGIPTVSLRNVSDLQGINEYSLVVKK